jgi:acyl-coenzyme A synthetase/AMP-(fatty) acid ligase
MDWNADGAAGTFQLVCCLFMAIHYFMARLAHNSRGAALTCEYSSAFSLSLSQSDGWLWVIIMAFPSLNFVFPGANDIGASSLSMFIVLLSMQLSTTVIKKARDGNPGLFGPLADKVSLRHCALTAPLVLIMLCLGGKELPKKLDPSYGILVSCFPSTYHLVFAARWCLIAGLTRPAVHLVTMNWAMSSQRRQWAVFFLCLLAVIGCVVATTSYTIYMDMPILGLIHVLHFPEVAVGALAAATVHYWSPLAKKPWPLGVSVLLLVGHAMLSQLSFQREETQFYYQLLLGHGLLLPLHYLLALAMASTTSHVGSFLAAPLLGYLCWQPVSSHIAIVGVTLVAYWLFMAWGTSLEMSGKVASASQVFRGSHYSTKGPWSWALHTVLYYCGFASLFWIQDVIMFVPGRGAIEGPMKNGSEMSFLKFAALSIALVSALTVCVAHQTCNILGYMSWPIRFMTTVADDETGKRKLTEQDPPFILFFRYVTRGTNPELVRNNIAHALKVLQDYDETGSESVQWQLEVVTDNPMIWEDVPTAVYSNVVEIVVPKGYTCKNGGKFKARAMNYAIKDSGPQRRGVGSVHTTPACAAQKHDWIVHLDEETLFNDHAVTKIFRFCVKENQRVQEERRRGNRKAMPNVGQGVILYNCHPMHPAEHILTTNADFARVGDDVGKFHFQYGVLGLPVIGMHGSFAVCSQEVEEAIGYDFGHRGNITEDSYFIVHAWAVAGIHARQIQAYMYEASPFSLMDFVHQRARWVHGMYLIATEPTKAFVYRFGLAVTTAAWSFLPFLMFFRMLLTWDVLVSYLKAPYGTEWFPTSVRVALLTIYALFTLPYQYVIGFVISTNPEVVGCVTWLAWLLGTIVTIPISASCELAGVLMGMKLIFKDNSEFYIVEKEKLKRPQHSISGPEAPGDGSKDDVDTSSTGSDSGCVTTGAGSTCSEYATPDSFNHNQTWSPRGSSEELNVEAPGQTMHGRFQMAVDMAPEKDAVIQDSSSKTFADVAKLVQDAVLQLCHRVQAEDRVVLIMERSLELCVHQFALWKLGCTLTCPSFKEGLDRTLVICNEFQPNLILVQEGHRLRALQETLGDVFDVQQAGVQECKVPKLVKTPQVLPTQSAAVFFTSGSTGVPKGVIYSHQHAVTFAELLHRELDISGRVLCRSEPQWAMFVWEAWTPLLFGGTVCMVEKEGEKDPEYLANYIAQQRINVFAIIPSFLNKLLLQMHDYGEELYSDLRHVICVGEPCPCSVAKSFNSIFTSAELVNYYALTETLSTRWHVPKSLDSVTMHGYLPAGEPEPGVSVLLLNENGQEADQGEIYFGGHLADGYINNHPENDRFVMLQGKRFYRTGDLGKWVACNGKKVLTVSGRCDRQVKVRGMRVELGEVECMIRQGAGGHTVVMKNMEELAAFVEAPEGSEEEVYKYCLRALPAHMRPSKIVCMPQLPRVSASEKVDMVFLRKLLEAKGYGNKIPTRPGSSNTDVGIQSEAGKHLIEQGVDSLGLMRTFTRMQKAEAQLLNQVYALGMWGIIMVHWQLKRDSIQHFIPAFGIAAIDILTQEHAWIVFCLAGGYLQSRESNFGIMKNLVLYAVFIFWWKPLPWIMSFLNTESTNALQTEQDWRLVPRWFLIAMVLARTVTSTMQLACVPAWMQTGLSLSLLLGLSSNCMIASETWVPTSHTVFVLFGVVPYMKILVVLFLQIASFHYLRSAVGHLKLGGTKFDTRLAVVVAGGLLFGLGASIRVGSDNIEQMCGCSATGCGVGWLLLELFTSVTCSLLLVAACAYAPCSILSWLGQGTFVAYVLHSFVSDAAVSLCEMVLIWINNSCGVFSGILSTATVLTIPLLFMAVSTLVFLLIIKMVQLIPFAKCNW